MTKLRGISWSAFRPLGLRALPVGAVGGMAAAAILFINLERNNLASSSNSYEDYWASHQLLIEYQQFSVDLVRAEFGDPAVTVDDVRTRLDHSRRAADRDR